MGPRERYLMEGPHQLDDVDLVQLILGTGGRGRPVGQLAMDVVAHFGGVAAMGECEPPELMAVDGVGPAQAARLHASLVLGRRASAPAVKSTTVIQCVEDAKRELEPRLRGLDHEQLHAVFVDRRLRVLGWRCLSRGSGGYTVVDPRHIFAVAVRLGAVGVVLAHNHPSGDATPSAADRDVTRRVAAAGRVLGIRLMDHLVVGDSETSSLAAEGLLESWQEGAVLTG